MTTVTNQARFGPVNSLHDNPYLEDGLSFSRTGLSFNNNGCGYAGCVGHVGFVGFNGNYMYGVGQGYFTMLAPTATRFHGLEFTVGTGWRSIAGVTWEAYNAGSLIASGSSAANPGDVIGFSSAGGFDELRYSDIAQFGTHGPAFDDVLAQTTSTVPEPGTWALMAAGLAMVGVGARRKRAVED